MTYLLSPRTTKALIGAVVVGIALSGCVSGGSDPGSRAILVAKSSAIVSLNAQGSHKWSPSKSLVVTAESGTLTNVTVTGRDGQQIRGKFANQHTSWRSSDRVLDFNTKYAVKTTAVDDSGIKLHRTMTVKTVNPKDRAYTNVTPSGPGVFGVGMPIIVTFTQPIQRKSAAESHLSVETQPSQLGSWNWVGDQMVRWRPKEYWKPGTKVTVSSDLKGLRLGSTVWGDDADSVHFSIGDAQISTVDIGSHTMTVRRNGQLVRTIPVTTGKPGWDTRIGTKVIMSKDPEVVMDAATIDVDKNSPEYYRLDVQYAMRLTWSGEYLHAAPWSVGDQGVDNVSHGCTGMSLSDAIWLYNSSKVGDVVNYVDGTRPMEPWNGYTDWNVSWSQWKAGSALN